MKKTDSVADEFICEIYTSGIFEAEIDFLESPDPRIRGILVDCLPGDEEDVMEFLLDNIDF